jgi:hypothetical protein
VRTRHLARLYLLTAAHNSVACARVPTRNRKEIVALAQKILLLARTYPTVPLP